MMKKRYATMLLSSVVSILLMQGCDSACCNNVAEDPIPPTAVITLNGQAVSSVTCDPAKEQTIVLKADSSKDSDGRVIDYIWKENNVVIQDGEVECPAVGQTKQVCLIAIDDDNLESQPACVTIKAQSAPAATTRPPIITIAKSNRGDGFIDCTQLHDQDTVNSDNVTNPYGTDKAIKEIYWSISYADGSTHSVTQTAWNNQDDSYPDGSCGKWVDNTKAPVTIKVTPIDDEDQNQTYIFTMDATGNITPSNN